MSARAFLPPPCPCRLFTHSLSLLLSPSLLPPSATCPLVRFFVRPPLAAFPRDCRPFLRLTLWQRLNLAAAVGSRSPVTNIPRCTAWGAAVMHRSRCPTYGFSPSGDGASTGHLRFQRARTRFYEWPLTSLAVLSRSLLLSLYLSRSLLLFPLAAPQDRLISWTSLTAAKAYTRCTSWRARRPLRAPRCVIVSPR